ncbi:formyltetrahydrofolate deformylase [Geobacillus subterraneus]|uniref:Formyltetrahydrofolate deformylase n=2 Tax=Geobacillus TaxID=129337 RepID=A0ABN4NMB8_9BACL|nr:MULTISPECIES: formyltetrahydrofolate deformylase [Geobacillus]AMX83590.1 formyltetrahydrofolate deformylase [Geobacillus subterraneus]KZS24985.1 formyltetrahydrofolate deformylase [Geobacillus subterraneus]OXB87823.1 formyltetrahydrofolate deformylase [Geobacillus uzenensis]QIZ67783.1 formyltetrahydrofolate deformylase [Geobacillus subterraneus]WPZ19993.1 formyltetrahydrofolate deformylase [Geobacillus subterraneus]
MSTFRQHRWQSFLQGYEHRARLLISCPDRPGIVAAVTSFLYEHGANIVESSQYSTDPEGGTFFLRLEFDCLNVADRKETIEAAFAPIAEEFGMTWQLRLHNDIRRIAIFVSKAEHCLLELLWQWQAGELIADIALVISNHPDLRDVVEPLGIPYVHIPVTKETKADAEAEQIRLLRDYRIDTIVLARYMQILSPAFVAEFPGRIINIHHSFLPAFIGARPYERAYERGVKLIGATSHYVTDDLDEGPIIEQDVARVDHRHHPDDLKRIGRLIEKTVLARALRWHLEDRVIIHGNKTIVFY